MAAGCCGVKKQKLNNSMPSICCNGSTVHPSRQQNGMIIRPDMCYFCFEVLYSHLNSCEPPKTPSFTNDPLWVEIPFKIISGLLDILVLSQKPLKSPNECVVGVKSPIRWISLCSHSFWAPNIFLPCFIMIMLIFSLWADRVMSGHTTPKTKIPCLIPRKSDKDYTYTRILT